MLMLGRPDAAAIRRLLESAVDAEPNYEEVGASLADALPTGYHHHRMGTVLGRDDRTFRRATNALRTWQAHLGAGIGVLPGRAAVAPGETVVVVLRLGLAHVLAPCRVIYVVDEPMRFGFAYGTLRGHPERGEEAFWVERHAGGEVTFRVASFSLPGVLSVKLAGPLGRVLQRRTSVRYVAAMENFVKN